MRCCGRGDDLEQDFARLPAFLRRLGPAAARYGALADQMGPAIANLDAQAPAVNGSLEKLGPFTKAAGPALQTLGDVADRGRQTFPRIRPLVGDLTSLGEPLRPLAKDLGTLSSSFDDAGGIESLMRFIYFYTGSVNGEDAQGHYIRSGLNLRGDCIARSDAQNLSCSSNYDSGATASQASAGSARATLLDYLMAP
jgi:phospholipid/cholesterol/gamma-HCH transport system substrate-binding protein